MPEDVQTSAPPTTDKAVLDKLASLEAEIVRLKTNPSNLPMTIHCNGCGDLVEEGKRCPKHPTEKVNYVRDDSVLAKQV